MTRWLLSAPLLLVALTACGGGFVREPDAAFAAAVEAHLANNRARGADASWFFLASSSTEDDRYDRAQLILAESLEGLELTHAASLAYLDVAASRRNPELIDRAVAGLERIVTTWPHDRDVIVDGFLATAEITGVQPERAAFVAYQQGLNSARANLPEWMEAQFRQIPDDSAYAYRADFVMAVRMLSLGQYDEGIAELDELLEDEEFLPNDLREEVRLALARLALEEERYDDAVEGFEAVRDAAPRRPTLLLEMAWAYFYAGNARRALGLLVALDAPMYRQLIAPERFLLEALSLRRLCQFEPAQYAAVRLAQRYRDALDDLHEGVAPEDSESLTRAARLRVNDLGSPIRLLARLKRERELVEQRVPAGDLRDHLVETYDAEIVNAENREVAPLRSAAAQLARELVEAEDGVRLVVHELSVALLRGRNRGNGPPEAETPDLSLGGSRVAYSFDGEFWTDELDDLVVVMPDRCLN